MMALEFVEGAEGGGIDESRCRRALSSKVNAVIEWNQ
jgi:hypothetical protein